jgi:hypothetical protein
MEVPEDRRFVGFDAYKKAMDCLIPVTWLQVAHQKSREGAAVGMALAEHGAAKRHEVLRYGRQFRGIGEVWNPRKSFESRKPRMNVAAFLAFGAAAKSKQTQCRKRFVSNRRRD